MRHVAVPLAVGLIIGTSSCREAGPASVPPGEKLFTNMPTSYTGIAFENRLRDTERFNVFTYRNYYNGGGVGLGDFNADGLVDVFLTANQDRNRLYLNRGDFRFEDITRAAGVGGSREWSTGVSIADVDGDGRLDIYVSNAGNKDGEGTANELFINEGNDSNGVPQFEDRAEAFGLDDPGYSTHAAFFDYDRDGDLDVYVLNNSFRPVDSFGLRNTRKVRDERGGDKLYRNDGGHFEDVSARAGIYGSEIGFGLGVTLGDVNQDGWLDIYISNDFFERDYLYINAHDGTFREELEKWMPHISLSSMGADMGDINNDGAPDIHVTDMLPESDRRLKMTSTFESWDTHRAKLRNGFYLQFMRNMLHLNNADGTFSEIGELAGVSQTDWSWGSLMADFDLDGYKDIFVANGIFKDVTNRDFIAYFSSEETMRQFVKGRGLTFMKLLDRIPSEPLANYVFRNKGNLRFENAGDEWGLDTIGFSNGAAFGDLDNDGDLDLVVNNVNMPAFVYRSELVERRHPHFLQVELRSDGGNRFGIGSKITAYVGKERLGFELIPTRGFQSSVDYFVTIGLGDRKSIDSLRVVWPDGAQQLLRNVPIDERIELNRADARLSHRAATVGDEEQLFTDITDEIDLEYTHRENDFVDFNRDTLLPRMNSTQGPASAVADVNGDGRDDFFIGGAKGFAGRLHLQTASGTFRTVSDAVFDAHALSEDVSAAFFDADGDGDQDLYVASGGSEWTELATGLIDRLYMNDGSGRLSKSGSALPEAYESSSVVRPGDFDADGDIDLFVGARLVPWKYGLPPRNRLLANNGTGTFRNVTETAAPGLEGAGMITDAVWADADGDRDEDLVVVGDWMAPQIFENDGGRLVRRDAGLDSTSGWWNRILADDLDDDGDLDFVLGNFGLNNRFNASYRTPVTLYVSDFDRNGWVDHLINHYRGGSLYPDALRDELGRRFDFIYGRFPDYASYAGAQMTDIFAPEQIENALKLEAAVLGTSILENEGPDGFRLSVLPVEAQFAPVFGILAGDFDSDGTNDLLLAGNFYGLPPRVGRMDALYGLFLHGETGGAFSPVPSRISGFFTPGETRRMHLLSIAGRKTVLVVKNSERPQFFQIR